jgi:hypothetical protein
MTDIYWTALTKTRQTIQPVELGNHRVSFCSTQHGYISTVSPSGQVVVRKWLVDIDGTLRVKSQTDGSWVKYRNQYLEAVRYALSLRKLESQVKVITTRLKSGYYKVEYRNRYQLSTLVKTEVLTLGDYAKYVMPLISQDLYLGAIS